MGGKNSAPAPPDYSQIAKASEKSAQYSYALGQDQLAWAKEQFAQNKQVADAVIEAALGRQEVSDAQAAKDRQRYEQIFQPLEEQLAYDAQTWASPERKEQAAGRAEADVAQQFQSARQTAAQKLEQFGVDPSQTRQGALDLQSRVAEAASRAGAGNQARNALDAQQFALRSEAINVGKGYPGQIAGQYGTALNSGNQAVNSGLATTASGASTMGTPTQWQQLGNQGLNIWGNTLNQGYQNQLAQFQANQQASSGIGSILGTGLGLAASFIPGLDEGGEVAMPHEGIPVPAGMSPTGGAQPDDVPAALTAGEFVFPKDVMQWKGQEWAQKEIMKARKQMGDPNAAPAQPEATPAPPGMATGGPVIRSAIPLGGRY
jgi:hypothetical protein